MKRIFAFFLVLCLLLTALPFNIFISAETQSGMCGDNVSWSFDSDTGTLNITGKGAMDYFAYSSSFWDSFKSSIKTVNMSKGITSISYAAFEDCSALQSITIPNSVTTIETYAFKGCYELEKISIPNSITYVGEYVFEDTKYYQTDSNWKNKVFYAGKVLVKAKPDISGSYSIKSGTTVIKEYAFYNCSKLTKITIPSSVKSIGYYTFYNCSGLKSVTIPSKVSYIDNYAFAYCDSLNTITVPESLTGYAHNAFYNCPIKKIIIANGSKKITSSMLINKYDITDVSIPETVTVIEESAFEACHNLENVNIPNSVTKIKDYAFAYCSKLKDIEIPRSVETLGNNAFSYCGNLSTLTISDSTSVSESAFADCEIKKLIISEGSISVKASMVVCKETLTEVVLPESLASVGEKAFNNCEKLSTINMPNGITFIGIDAFNNTPIYNSAMNWENDVLYIDKHLIASKDSSEHKVKDGTVTIASEAFKWNTSLKSVTIPNSVISICDRVFYDCTNLENIVLPDSIIYIGDTAFHNTAYYNNQNNWKEDGLYIGNHLIEVKNYIKPDYIVRDGTVTICGMALNNNNLIENVIIPSGVTTIGNEAFASCDNLKSVKIPNSVSFIGKATFEGTDNVVLNIDSRNKYAITFAENHEIKYTTYKCPEYKIIFKDYNGTIISESTYFEGDLITVPENPTRESSLRFKYNFLSWDNNIEKTAKRDIIYTAQYEKIEKFSLTLLVSLIVFLLVAIAGTVVIILKIKSKKKIITNE